ncbi:MAG: c-type cytochrome [Mariprofundaceae bacterium]|nr:c-type cytochrome [Mariprofundaceae bacterium]
MKYILFVLLMLPLVSVPAQAGDAGRGKIVAEVRCLPCHQLYLKSKRVGPGLKGIFNRKPTISGVPFERWDAASLEAWLTDPRAIKANTTMVMPFLKARDRNDIIAYFEQAESSAPDIGEEGVGENDVDEEEDY